VDKGPLFACNWADLLHMAEFAWNNHYHSSLGMTPFFANYGMHPTMTNVPLVGQQDTPKRIERILRAQEEEITEELERAQKRQGTQYNKKRQESLQLEIGDKVYLATNNLITDEGSKKLSDLRMGPFEVTKKVGTLAYCLKLLPHMKVHPVFNVALLSKFREDPISGRAPTELAPIIVEGQAQYEIEKILDSNWMGKHFQYKVTYKGYGKEHDEWQFRDDLLEDMGKEALHQLEAAFYTRNPAKLHTDTVREREKPLSRKSSCLTLRHSRHLGGTVTKPDLTTGFPSIFPTF